MPIQTAPSTITVAVTGGNTVFTLSDVADNSVTYRAMTVGGTALSQKMQAPVLSISRRPASRQNPNVKYVIRCTTPTLDLLGNTIGLVTDQREFVVSNKHAASSAGFDAEQLFKAVSLAMGETTLLSILSDGSMFR